MSPSPSPSPHHAVEVLGLVVQGPARHPVKGQGTCPEGPSFLGHHTDVGGPGTPAQGPQVNPTTHLELTRHLGARQRSKVSRLPFGRELPGHFLRGSSRRAGRGARRPRPSGKKGRRLFGKDKGFTEFERGNCEGGRPDRDSRGEAGPETLLPRGRGLFYFPFRERKKGGFGEFERHWVSI